MVLVDVNNRYHGFHTLAKRRFFPRFSSTRRNMPAFKPFLQYFLKDLTPLHVRITRSTNLLSVCQRKLKLSTYLHCIDISFLNTRSQLVWVLGTAGSSGFYSMTWRINGKYKFIFKNSLHSEETSPKFFLWLSFPITIQIKGFAAGSSCAKAPLWFSPS